MTIASEPVRQTAEPVIPSMPAASMPAATQRAQTSVPFVPDPGFDPVLSRYFEAVPNTQ